jgi:hypothetical protein
MASFLDVCRFTAVSSGTGDFVVSAAVTGYQTPASAGATNGATYRYRAESADLSQWEVGYGAYTTGSTTLARTTILFSSTGSKVSFSAAPQVAIVALAEDLNTFVVGVIGTDVQAYDSDLAALAVNSTNGLWARTGTGTGSARTITGTSNKISVTNGDGVSGNPTLTVGSDVLDKTATATLAVGYSATSYSGGSQTGSSPTYTPAAANGNFQHITLNGSSLTGTFTVGVPSTVCSILLEIVNSGSGSVAASFSTSGFTKVTGDTWASTNGNKYAAYITKTNSYSHLHLQALQ